MKYLVIILQFFSITAMAEESYLRYGVGVGNSGKESVGETKLVSLGVVNPVVTGINALSFLAYQLEGGGWIDTKSGQGRKNSLYASASTGMNITSGPLKIYSLHGPGLISTPDAYLGSVPQFFHDIGLGLEDNKSGASIGVGYKHISNAGIFSDINKGRDFMTIKLAIPW